MYINNIMYGFNTFNTHIKRFKNLSTYALLNEITDKLSILYKWEGLPTGVKSSDIEKKLVMNGYLIAFVYDGDLIFARGNINKIDIYNNPTEVSIIEPYGDKAWKNAKLIKGKDTFVIIRNTTSYSGVIHKIYDELTHIDTITSKLQMNLETAGIKYILNDNIKNNIISSNSETDKAEEKSWNELLTSNDAVRMASFTSDEIDGKAGAIPLIPLEVKALFGEYIEARNRIEQKIQERLGAPKVLSDKKERLVTSESDMPNTFHSLGIKDGLLEREYFIEEMKETYGIELSVELDELNNVYGVPLEGSDNNE